jgi:hypothetical protein
MNIRHNLRIPCGDYASYSPHHSSIISAHHAEIIARAALAFGFVYIHPFEDGNGRIHPLSDPPCPRRTRLQSPGVAFPVSAAILDRIDRYRRVLESYSQRLLPLIQWETTPEGCLLHRHARTHDRPPLHQNGGRVSQRARKKEFAALTDEEATRIETIYREAFGEA